MAEFDAVKARTKYACPIWVDAFLRDTLDLSADEIGAYHLILYAMWSRAACNLPDDDRKLARVARSSPQLWKRRIRPALEPFFEIEDGEWSNRRLLREAAKTEKFLAGQSARKKGCDKKVGDSSSHSGAQLGDTNSQNISDKPLENNKPTSTADQSPDQSGDHPTQETKRPSIYGGGGGTRETAKPARLNEPSDDVLTEREQLLEAMGADPISGMVGPNGARAGSPGDMIHVQRWSDDLGLTLDEQVAVIRDVVTRKPDGPPSSLRYFTKAMERFAAIKAEPDLSPAKPNLTAINGGRNGQPTFDQKHEQFTRAVASGEIHLGPDPSDPFGGR